MELEQSEVEFIPQNTKDIERKIWAIKACQKQIEQFDNQKRESDYFYQQKTEGLIKQIEFLKQQIGNYLSMQDTKKLSLPAGTVYYQTRTKKVYPDDAILQEWVKSLSIEWFSKIQKLTPSISKTELQNYIEATGNIPDGYNEIPETNLVIKMND